MIKLKKLMSEDVLHGNLIGNETKDENLVRQFVSINSLNPVLVDIWGYGVKNLNAYPSKIVSLGNGKAGMKYNLRSSESVEVEIDKDKVLLYSFYAISDAPGSITSNPVRSGKFSYALFRDLMNGK